jgi:regulator of protease activity HflC (stomatin/prohibitin superfamily)
MGGIVVLIFMILGLVLAGILLPRYRKAIANRWGDDSDITTAVFFWGGIGLFAFMLVLFICKSFIVIDQTEVGVQIMFGRVLEQPLTAGFKGKSPFADVVKYDLRVHEYTMSSVPDEGAKKGVDDSVKARTHDNLNIDVDATVWWAVDPLDAADVYKKIGNDTNSLTDIVIRQASRSSIQNEVSNYDLTDLILERGTVVTTSLTSRLKDVVSGKGVIIDHVLLQKFGPPKEVDDAIKAKLVSQQQLEQKTFDLQQAVMNAKILVQNAKGIAESQEIIQSKLTPLYVQWKAIESVEKLAGSPNATFYMIPMNPNGTGVPIIMGAPSK